MPTLETLRTLTPVALHTLIAMHCEHWTALTPQEHAQTGCTHRAPDGGLHTVPDYTEDWAALMPLALKYGITQGYLPSVNQWELYHRDLPGGFVVVPGGTSSQPLHRRRLAELVLWVAMQAQAQASPPHQDGSACRCVLSTAGYAQHHGAPTGTLPDAFYEAMRTFEAPAPQEESPCD